MKKKILIFIITYKASFRLLKVYKSIPFKKLKKYKINVLISDDKSDDDTIKYARKIYSKNKNIKLNFNKKNLPSNFFVSGNFDLENLRASFYEVSGSEKLSNDDINFIEQEFNDFMLEDGLRSLFLFPKFKEFIKSITSEVN